MKTAFHLFFLLIALTGLQVFLERDAEARPEIKAEIDTIDTKFKIENGGIYFLDKNRQWIEKESFLWRSKNGLLFQVCDNTLYYSGNGKSWKKALYLPESSPHNGVLFSNLLRKR
jgi:hypothetical protein